MTASETEFNLTETTKRRHVTCIAPCCDHDAFMTLTRRRFLHRSTGALEALAAPEFACAQSYPARPVRMIVPFPPGGPTDVCARLIAQKLSDRLGRQFYVENIAGASGNIGTGQAARAAPDGHTILITVNTHVINPTLFAKVPYDAYKDFEPVTLAVGFATGLVVHSSQPANTVAELIALIKANPGKYASRRPGSGRRRISSASNCGSRSASTSCTCRLPAAGPRSPRSSPAISRSALRHSPPPRLMSPPARCARSRS